MKREKNPGEKNKYDVIRHILKDYASRENPITRKEIEDNYREQAEKNVKSRLVLEAIIKEEKIEASQEEVDEKIKEMATSYGRKEEELRKNEALVEYLRNSVKTEKAIELIVKNAKIKK